MALQQRHYRTEGERRPASAGRRRRRSSPQLRLKKGPLSSRERAPRRAAPTLAEIDAAVTVSRSSSRTHRSQSLRRRIFRIRAIRGAARAMRRARTFSRGCQACTVPRYDTRYNCMVYPIYMHRASPICMHRAVVRWFFLSVSFAAMSPRTVHVRVRLPLLRHFFHFNTRYHASSWVLVC